MYEKINNLIWNTLAILCLMGVGYALAMAQVAYREEDDPPVQDIVTTPCPARRQCDFNYAVDAFKAAQEALNTKSIQATPQSAKAAYRDCRGVLTEAVLMLDHPNR